MITSMESGLVIMQLLMKTVPTQKYYMNQLYQNLRICFGQSLTFTLMVADLQNMPLMYQVKSDHTLTPFFMVDVLHSILQLR